MNSKVRILIIDDELDIRNVLKMSLQANLQNNLQTNSQTNYKICEAVNGKSGIAMVSDFHPHLVILDLGLPDMPGIDVLRHLRTWTRVPVIVLTVTDDEQSKVSLLDAGADDYLTKPFGAKELLARVRVALRNVGLIEATPFFKSDDLEVDLTQKKVMVSGEEVKFTATEFELLSRLVRDHGRVLPQAVLLKQVWGQIADGQTHYLRIYINQLRKKIEADPANPKHILTEPGVGYKLV